MPTKPKQPAPEVIHMVCTEDLSNHVGEYRAYDPSTQEAKAHVIKSWERVVSVAAIPHRTQKSAKVFAKFWAGTEEEIVERMAVVMARACGSLWENLPETKRHTFLKCSFALLAAIRGGGL